MSIEHFKKFEAALIVASGLMMEMEEEFKVMFMIIDEVKCFMPVHVESYEEAYEEGWKDCPQCPYCKKVQTAEGKMCNQCDDYTREASSLPME